MYSTNIIESPFIVFLGAGASRPIGKRLMGEFIDYLEKDKGFKDRPLFREIVSRERDLEFLLDELEQWGCKDYFAPSVSALVGETAYGQFGTAAMDRSEREFRERFQQTIYEAMTLQAELKREIFLSYREITNPAAVPQLFAPLFEAISAAQISPKHPLVVFTTNYDPSIETFCTRSATQYHLCDGFFHDESSMSYVWRRREFDEFRLSASKTHIVLFKLHGSTNWTKSQSRITKSPASIYVEADSTHENVLIYPAKTKVAIEEPYFTAYDYFQRCAERCRLCIVIGYSFRDYDALTKLMSAAAANRALSLLVIDPSAEKLCQQLAGRQIKAEPIPVKFGFGPGVGDYVLQVKAALATSG